MSRVPVSVVYRKDFPRDGSGRLHLYGYGAYGIAIPPAFSASRLSLLDRFDTVLLMEAGRVLDIGPRNAVLARQPLLQRMVQPQ